VDLKGRTLVPGDVVEIEIEGIGVLRNPVVAEDRVNVRAMAKVDQTPSR
jgi:fumarylacetoacetate (FAA) hydrolase family protein